MTDRSKISYEKIKGIMQEKGYRYYTAPYDLNLVGIRSRIEKVNIFDDWLAALWTDGNGQRQMFLAAGTTLPGLYRLESPMNQKGTAILKPGQYRSCWQVGMFTDKKHGSYKALIQVGNMTVYRDNDKDRQIDIIPGTEDSGNFGIDLHRRIDDDQGNIIYANSAGCQVFERAADFDSVMALVNAQIKAGLGDLFTYTLLEESDFEK